MNFKIKYSLYKGDDVIKWGTIKVKNKDNELEAKIKLEKYFRKKFTFDNMVIHLCEQDTIDMFGDLFGFSMK
jgi:hypothetical protein